MSLTHSNATSSQTFQGRDWAWGVLMSLERDVWTFTDVERNLWAPRQCKSCVTQQGPFPGQAPGPLPQNPGAPALALGDALIAAGHTLW